MNARRLYIFLLALGLIFMPTRAHENDIKDTIDNHIAYVVGKNNVTKAKIGGAIAAGALGLFGVWFLIRKHLQQDTQITETISTTQKTDDFIKVYGAIKDIPVPDQYTVWSQVSKIKNSCSKKRLRPLFCIRKNE